MYDEPETGGLSSCRPLLFSCLTPASPLLARSKQEATSSPVKDRRLKAISLSFLLIFFIVATRKRDSQVQGSGRIVNLLEIDLINYQQTRPGFHPVKKFF